MTRNGYFKLNKNTLVSKILELEEELNYIRFKYDDLFLENFVNASKLKEKEKIISDAIEWVNSWEYFIPEDNKQDVIKILERE